MKAISRLRPLAGLVLLLVAGSSVIAQTAQAYQSPDDAAKSLIAAARAKDQAKLDRIFAPNASRLRSGDQVQEADEMTRFADLAAEKTELTKVDDTRYT